MMGRIASASSKEIKTLDLTRLQELEEFDSPSHSESLVLSVIQLFLSTTPELFKQLDTYAEKSDIDKVSKTAHSLKSSCANIGAMRLATMCFELESCKEQARQPSPKQIQNVREEFNAVCADLRFLLREL